MQTLLIANRGEIAVRVARTAKAMGLRVAAVYSEADRDAAHVAAADTALCIGPAPARESYLDIPKIIDAARRLGADMVHPGYGFLSENASFAQACEEVGLIFVGPPVSAIEAMGSKAGAKALMVEADVPVVPGYQGEDQGLDTLVAEAARIGYPVLLKASAGGGGKGMRRVDTEAEIAEAIAAAQREALSAFGDSRLIIEKYLLRPRHVEVQVFADTHGDVVHLHERDCSVQRRHQKVVEEAPAPDLRETFRSKMGLTAVAAAKAIGYVGAGTVEFIVDDSGYYFMEMNTRLQVEHPVTELITGTDLVDWQIRIARGERLPLGQSEIAVTGHAIEARLYAEDPERGFLPQTGRLDRLRFPDRTDGLRIDAGVREGDTVGIHYDPMIAKVIAWGRDRRQAIDRLSRALAETEIAGLDTNIDYLGRIIDHPAFRDGDVHTGFIEDHADGLAASSETPKALRICAALAVAFHRRRTANADRAASPWDVTDGWTPFAALSTTAILVEGEEDVRYEVTNSKLGFTVSEGEETWTVSGTISSGGQLDLLVGEDRVFGRVFVSEGGQGGRVAVTIGGARAQFAWVDPIAASGVSDAAGGRLEAPMPGRIVQVAVADGQKVTRGTTLLVLEAMKMEHAITAPADGVVTAVHVAEGAMVEEGVDLVAFEAEAAS